MTRFTQKWGPEVRELVENAAHNPARPSARAIHQALLAGATGENGALRPSDIPPQATIAQWVSEHRRNARDVLTGNPDKLEKIAADLLRRLEAQARAAKTTTQIASCAKAAREVAGLHRDLRRPEPQKPGRKPRDTTPQDTPGARPAPEDPDTAFLKSLESTDSA